jgi:flagellar hook-length control protein FliK
MLTALLPASVPSNNADTKISGSESKDQPDSQVALPGGVNPIPVDLLALVVPAVAADASGMQQNAKGNQEPLKPVESSPVVQTSAISGLNSTAQLIATEGLNSATQSAAIEGLAATELNKKVMPPDTNPLQVETITSGAQNAALAPSAEKTVPKGGIVPADLNLTPDGLKENSFASAMASIGKEAANSENLATVAAAKLASAATGSHSQQVESATDNSLMQSGMMAASPSQNVGLQSAQTVIKTPVTDRAWANEFNQKVTWMATRQEQTAELHLNPPHLGPLDVVLKVSGDQATALFTSPHAAVREAVEQALPQLRNMLAENGITLGNAMVNDQSPKDRQAWQAGQQQKEKGSTVGSIETTHSSAGNLSNSGTSPSSRHQGMVDTFA